jgi:hypothetical protein
LDLKRFKLEVRRAEGGGYKRGWETQNLAGIGFKVTQKILFFLGTLKVTKGTYIRRCIVE